MAGGAALGATVLFVPAAEAATFTVNTLADSDDGSCADDCSLREAAELANAAADADEITFASGLSGKIRLTDSDGQIPLYAATTITGPGADVLAVSGRDTYRIFYVNADNVGAPNDPVTISGLELTNGYGSPTADDGGALYSDNTTLTLSGIAFTNNEAEAGGAVWSSDGNLVVENSSFSGNTSTDWGGALYLSDTQGSTADEVEARISNSTFTDNVSSGSPGGAVDIDDPDGDVVIENTTISGNEAEGEGGGIVVDNVDNDGDLTIRATTVANNTADAGGGITVRSVSGNMVIENSTISGNSADYSGAGIYFGYLYDDQTTTIRNSTIAGNAASIDDSAAVYAGGGIYLYDATEDTTAPIAENGPVTISSTIIANNTADEGADLGQGAFADGFIVGHSLFGAAERITGAAATIAENPAGSNLVGVDSQLGPLADNGGPTPTHEPAASSAVLDAGTSNGLAADQRGLARTFDASNVANAAASDGTDIGAVELAAEGTCKGKAATVLFDPGQPITGGDGKDVIVGTDDVDQIDAGGGKDLICAAGGKDRVKGGVANDRVLGGGGKDALKGNAGRDILSGQGGSDSIKGNAGNDVLKGQGGKDKLSGGGGKDKLRGGPGKDKLSGGPGKDSERQ